MTNTHSFYLLRRRLTGAVICCWLASLCAPVMAFEISGKKWSGASMQFYTQLSGTSLTGINWQDAFLSALEEWNDKTDFNFVPVLEYSDPCGANDLSSVDFTADQCGSEFGANTLAVTLTRYESQVLGPAKIVEADIVVNSTLEFNVFDGNIRQFGVPGLDFRRIALHELGHVIGLDHEPELPAIMAPNIGDTYQLQADDIDGANTLYGGLSACGVTPIGFGVISNALDESDCRVLELTVGGDDTSFIDVYQLQLGSLSTIQLQMASSGLDSVLLLADSDFNYIAVDDKSSGSCDSLLERELLPGRYYVLANTYDEPVRSDCGNTGAYSLTVGYSAASPHALTGNLSLAGGQSTASYRGGVKVTGSNSFGNVFSSAQSLDIEAQIDIDPEHQGQEGFLVVAALIDGQILVQDGPQGTFGLYDPALGIPHVADKILSAQETITIARNLVPADIGIDAITANFVVGYGLVSDPGEVFHHQTPINLTVTP